MRSALRSTAAVVVGFIVASVVMMIVEAINGHLIHPDLAKAAEGVTDREALERLAGAPRAFCRSSSAGWILGSVAGGWTTARIATGATVRHCTILGVLLTLAGIANNLMIPPPTWFWIAIVVFVPAAYIGARLAPQR
ncbi:MAG: hypothetical protein U0V87_17225 [Acidobacteriota bacterium]